MSASSTGNQWIASAYSDKPWHYGEMKVVLRADASKEIGTGHVMRQFAIAEQLLRRGVEVFFVGEVVGLRWLEEKLASLKGLQRVSQSIGTFESGVLREIGAHVSTIDSYSLGQHELEIWESQSPTTLVFIDGPWQRLRGAVAVAPMIEDSSPWVEELRNEFSEVHFGPDYLMIREEIKCAKKQREKNPPSEPQILVVIGGADARGYTELVVSILCRLAEGYRIVVMEAGDRSQLSVSPNEICDRVVYVPRTSFVDELTKSTLVIAGAGSVSSELLFLKIPTVFIPVAANQLENARAIERILHSSVVHPEAPEFQASLLDALEQVSNTAHSALSYERIDGLGSSRIASLLFGNSGL